MTYAVIEDKRYEEYPFVLKSNFGEFRGKPVAFVGKVKNNSGGKLYLIDNNGRC